MAAVRLPRVNALTVDRALAVLLFASGELQVLLADEVKPNRVVAAVVIGAVTAGVAFRRRFPALIGIGTQAVMATTWIFGQLPAGPVTVGWFCALYAMTVWTSTRWFVVAVVFFAVSEMFPLSRWQQHQGPLVDPFTMVVVTVMVFLRIAVGGRDRMLRVAQRERDVSAREAVVEERARIARELHDVIAHHVSTMVVQAGAERRLLDHGKGDAREVLGSIETVGRSALTEMRRMVTILRQDRAEGLLPQPTLADVPALVEHMRSAGLSVTLQQSGEPAEMPIGLQLSAYRIVQEALTNALKHAGGAPVEVQIRHAPNELGLVIRDQGRGHADSGEEPGHGLAGMRERVAMYGGLIETGLQQDGGFAVRVLLPVR